MTLADRPVRWLAWRVQPWAKPRLSHRFGYGSGDGCQHDAMPELLNTRCPYCGELIELLVDDSLAAQSYIEDCAVCCQPMTVTVHAAADGSPSISVARDDDA